MKTEKDFLNEIKKKRRKLIEKADKKHISNTFDKSPRKNFVILVLIIIVCLLYLSVYAMTRVPNNTTIKQNHFHYNITENIIKGEQEMICVGDVNKTKIICYNQKEVK